MTDPIDLDAYRPHLVSKMLCTRCGHKWTAVHPVGTTGLECPNCHETEKAVPGGDLCQSIEHPVHETTSNDAQRD